MLDEFSMDALPAHRDKIAFLSYCDTVGAWLFITVYSWGTFPVTG